MSYAWVECQECDEQFDWNFVGEIDVCPHCRSVDSLEETEPDEPEPVVDKYELEADALYEQWKAGRDL
jgi:hypothetical protein